MAVQCYMFYTVICQVKKNHQQNIYNSSHSSSTDLPFLFVFLVLGMFLKFLITQIFQLDLPHKRVSKYINKCSLCQQKLVYSACGHVKL